MERYRHTQIGFVTTVGLLIVAAFCGYLVFRTAMWPPLIAAVIGLIIAAVFSTLTTSVGDGVLEVWFGSGLIRRKIEMREIESVAVVQNPWFYGWGIHWTPNGWLWNVSGAGAVELHFRDGHKFRIGSDEPELLAAAIRLEIGFG